MLLAWVRGNVRKPEPISFPLRVFRLLSPHPCNHANSRMDRRRSAGWLPRNWKRYFNVIPCPNFFIFFFFYIKYSSILTSNSSHLFEIPFNLIQPTEIIIIFARDFDREIGSLNFARLLFLRTRWIRLQFERETRNAKNGGFEMFRQIVNVIKIDKHS